ncbi:hypothetical protein [Thermococcus sp.]|uniref:hypothetical protein n=1 Tax=Thermococcus sp. TaxID=35749 RepID=UPI00260C1C44|nr:hypothetical protein [Thermococcus sp.]
MRKCLALIPLLLLLLSMAQPLGASPSTQPAYVIPAFPVMFHLTLASNGSTAFLLLRGDVYSGYVDYMCPIDSPDSDFQCHVWNRTDDLLIEFGNGTRLANVTWLLGYNSSSFAPFGHRWFLVYPHAVREYFPSQKRFGKLVNVSALTDWTLYNLPTVMSLWPRVSNGSLVFSSPYNGTYSVPLGLLRPYLEPLAFNVSEGLSERRFLEYLRAVPFRGGLLIYLPTYGISLCGNGSLVVENFSNPYLPHRWVYYKGGEFPEKSFPLVLYYRNGRLRPLLTFVPYGDSLALSVPEFSVSAGGNSSVPEIEVPTGWGRVYLWELGVYPHYSPTNTTFIDLEAETAGWSDTALHAELINGSRLVYLNVPVPGSFYYFKDHWFYECASCHPKRYYLYDWRNHTLIEGNFSPSAVTEEVPWYHVWNVTSVEVVFNDYRVDFHRIPLANFSGCVPNDTAIVKRLQGIQVGNGVLLYFRDYQTGLSLAGEEWALSHGVPLSSTCPFFYYAGGRIRFRMKLGVAHATVPVGNWRLTLSYPYINATPMVNVSVVRLEAENTTPTVTPTPLSNTTTPATTTSPAASSTSSPTSGRSIRGPGTFLLLAVIVLILWKLGRK